MTTLLDKLRSVADKDKVDPLRNGFVVITENELERFAKLMQREALLELSEWCLYEKRRLHGEREFEYKVGVDIVRDEINNRAKELE